MNDDVKSKAEVISVFPDRVRIAVSDVAAFSGGRALKVGSYLRITDTEDAALIAAIENFCLEAANDKGVSRHVIEALPLGLISDGKFVRGGDALTIPPTGAEPATEDDIRMIFQDSVEAKKSFTFAELASDPGISVPVDGNRFFNKHIAVVGSTGAGKSHTISNIIQTAVAAKESTFSGLSRTTRIQSGPRGQQG